MSLNLGAAVYVSVIWTNGDTITETKLDNMVNNDQAYDSHAAQGLLLNNTYGLFGKNSGGTAQQLLGVNSSNIIEFGDADLTSFENLTKIGALLRASADQTVSSGADETIEWNTEDADPGSDYNTGTYTFTCPNAGWYLCHAHVNWTNIGANAATIKVKKNGSTIAQTFVTSWNDNDIRSVTALTSAAANDTLTFAIRQNTGVDKNLNIDDADSNRAFIVKLF